MANALSYIASETRQYDRDRFLCSLFAPEETREALFTVLAFNIEISKTREMVRESLLGEIRLQWWRDSIELIYNDPSGVNSDNLVVAELASVIKKFKLSRALFEQLIDSRSRDLIDVPFNDEIDLCRYAYETSSTLCKILLEILCPASSILLRDEISAAESVGMAWALTGMVRASTSLAKQKRMYIPKKLFEEFGFNNDEFYAQNATEGILKATSYIVDLARIEIACARNLLKGRVKRRYVALLLQASLAELYLNRIESLNFNPFSPKIENGRVWRQLKIAFMAARGSF
jgi:NADH dehydrogenase [ubiquinone] 1 alpha subcomplex assembly factor 6